MYFHVVSFIHLLSAQTSELMTHSLFMCLMCVCVCLSLSRLSSDLLKGLMSGAQSALPPHLQLAFSGKLWAVSSVRCICVSVCVFIIISSVSVCRCQSNPGWRLEEEAIMTSESSSEMTSDPGLAPPTYALSANCPVRQKCFYTHMNMNNVIRWMMMMMIRLYICINVYTDRPETLRTERDVCVCVRACVCMFISCSICKCSAFYFLDVFESLNKKWMSFSLSHV